jgi:hypothetical protein
VRALAESVRALAESVRALAESVPALAESVPALAESVPALAESVRALAESVRALAESVIALGENVPAFRENVLAKVEKKLVAYLEQMLGLRIRYLSRLNQKFSGDPLNHTLDGKGLCGIVARKHQIQPYLLCVELPKVNCLTGEKGCSSCFSRKVHPFRPRAPTGYDAHLPKYILGFPDGTIEIDNRAYTAGERIKVSILRCSNDHTCPIRETRLYFALQRSGERYGRSM